MVSVQPIFTYRVDERSTQVEEVVAKMRVRGVVRDLEGDTFDLHTPDAVVHCTFVEEIRPRIEEADEEAHEVEVAGTLTIMADGSQSFKVLAVELLSVPVNQATAKTNKPKRKLTAKALITSNIVGIWSDREDIVDDVAFARDLRERAWQRRGDRL